MTSTPPPADTFTPVLRESLSDRLAREIRQLIQRGEYVQGDRLPAIAEMARRFGVGHPTIREALKTLEAVGVVEIRHGSGVYVNRSGDVFLVASPDFGGTVTKKLLLDLVRTRIALEGLSAADAAEHATEEHLAEMRRLLATAGAHLADDEVLAAANLGFHREIARASGNGVLAQLLDVLGNLFTAEQRLILSIFGLRDRDHAEHLGILDALERRNRALATKRMRAHLEGVSDAIRRWDPERHPVE